MDEAVNQKKQEEDQNELLFWACARGLLADAMELVARGADAHASDKRGRCPLHYAAAHGHEDVVRFLASHGVDVDADDQRGRTPLHYAALGGHVGTVKALTGKQGRCWVDASDGDGNTPLHLAASGFAPSGAAPPVATALGAAVSARGLQGGCESGGAGMGDLDDTRDSRVDAARVEEQRHSAGAVIHALHAAHAQLEPTNSRALTPLGAAVVSGNAVAVSALLKAGARPEALARGFSLMHLAAGLGQAACLRLLLSAMLPTAGTGASAQGAEGMKAHVGMCVGGLTPLHAAAMAGSLECATLLLEHGAPPAAATPEGLLAADLVPSRTSTTGSTAGPHTSNRTHSPHSAQDPHTSETLEQLRSLLRSSAAAQGGSNAQQARSSGNSNDNSASTSRSAQQHSAQNAAAGIAGRDRAQHQSTEGSEEGQETLQQRFLRMDEQDRVRKVDAYARMPDRDLASLPYMPRSALPLIRQLRRAHALLACWQPIVALRSDADLQKDLADTQLRFMVEELSKPGVDVSRYRIDSQVKSVLTKVSKMYAVLREHGQGVKVTLADLRATPHGPSSVHETKRQLHNLEQRVESCQQQAIRHILEGGKEEEAQEGQQEQQQQQQQQQQQPGEESSSGVSEGQRGKGGAAKGTQGSGAPAENKAGGSTQAQGQGKDSDTGVGSSSSGSSSSGSNSSGGSIFGQEFRRVVARLTGLHKEEEAHVVPSWGAVLWALGRHLGRHMLRIAGMFLLMLIAMNMLGLMPDQLRAKAQERQETLGKAAASARASGSEVLMQGGQGKEFSSTCQSGSCTAKRSKRKTAYERVSERAEERERKAEVQRLERLIERKEEGIELEGLSETEDEKGAGRSEL